MLPPIENFHSIGAEFLSNFFGVAGTTVEHRYQAAKTTDQNWKSRIMNARTPAEAKQLGRQCPVSSNWNDIKLGIMKELLEWKFSFPHLREQLLKTGDRELIEGNTWNDTFWGVCKGVGENHLGKLLMEVREEIKKEVVV